MAYIDRAQLGSDSEECIFCEAVGAADGGDNLVVHRRPMAICMLNRFPYNPGHLMVAPGRHGGELAELDQAELGAVMDELKLATRVLQAELNCEGLNGGWNQGRAAGAGIDSHLHFHLVPRWNGDTNFMPVLADVKVIPEYLKATAAKLRVAFQSHQERA
jgi:ATP adenylyltransferase